MCGPSPSRTAPRWMRSRRRCVTWDGLLFLAYVRQRNWLIYSCCSPSRSDAASILSLAFPQETLCSAAPRGIIPVFVIVELRWKACFHLRERLSGPGSARLRLVVAAGLGFGCSCWRPTPTTTWYLTIPRDYEAILLEQQRDGAVYKTFATPSVIATPSGW